MTFVKLNKWKERNSETEHIGFSFYYLNGAIRVFMIEENNYWAMSTRLSLDWFFNLLQLKNKKKGEVTMIYGRHARDH